MPGDARGAPPPHAPGLLHKSDMNALFDQILGNAQSGPSCSKNQGL
eukprot:CAMPEP_0202904706 /NCGR_PEP_ID=MMETSP1392-20130828/30741_1 /ASSEMBLY_ACC=CAM_ASM_000868 /TAXON_ID=225041 /ORGANISM="Chlamydomonas chlamydogama, Strain SAG 11-48b" /LENGTH=45 /DNA_ID= /DNA_START= /DNA_END= /DNA_ORIENTATION=